MRSLIKPFSVFNKIKNNFAGGDIRHKFADEWSDKDFED